MEYLVQAQTAFGWVVLGYFFVLKVTYFVKSVAAFRSLRGYARRLRAMDINDLISSVGAPPVTIIAPAFNEVANCVDSVKSTLLLDYPDFDIMVVNDGSTDETFTRLEESYHLKRVPRMPTSEIPTEHIHGIYRSETYPNVWVIDKDNGGKADALNAGINYCRTPLYCAVDADSVLDREALKRVVRPFLENSDTIAAGGIVRIANGCTIDTGTVRNVRLPKSFIARVQVLEYLRAFLSGRMGWDAMNATLIISGAFGLFHRSTVVNAGGYATDTVAEDMEIVVRLHRYCRERKIKYRISFIPDPVAWTEVPERLRDLSVQRSRWQRGLCQVMWRHRKILWNTRYGAVGMFAYPYFFLEAVGPVIEALGYLNFFLLMALGMLKITTAIAYLMMAIVLGMALSLSAVGLEELSFPRYKNMRDFWWLKALSFLEALGYRQLTVYWRVKGVIAWLFRRKGWGKMQRRGFQP